MRIYILAHKYQSKKIDKAVKNDYTWYTHMKYLYSFMMMIMKKLLISLSLAGILWGLISTVSADTTSCKNVYFGNGVTACVNIGKVGTDRRSLTTNLNGGSISSLKCDVMLPDSNLRSVSSCNGEFFYDVQKIGRIKFWIRYDDWDPRDRIGKSNTGTEWTYPQWIYDFNNKGRAADNLQDAASSLSNTSKNKLDNFYLTTNNTSPYIYQYIDMTIRARDNNNYTLTDYTDAVDFKVYYRAFNSSSRIQTASSAYYTINTNYANGYDFNSSDHGIANLKNFIKFNKREYDYKVRVYDENDTSIYKEIIFNGSSTNWSSDMNGFTSAQISTVQGIYNGRNTMINNLKNRYSRLQNNSRRQNMSDNIKNAAQQIINNNSYKTYNNFTDFYAAFLDWYRYTISIR